jgi:ATP-dependent Lhr-like helicase
MLLERYGVVSREVADAEPLPGGFSPVYQVLKSMEEAGRIRRGYFVEGLSGAQFGHPGAIDRLRQARPAADPGSFADAELLWLAANDPAQVYGGLLPWPVGSAGPEARPRRVAGAYVLLGRGQLLLYVGKGGSLVQTFAPLADETARTAAFRALRLLPGAAGRRSRLVVEKVDGVPVAESVHAAALVKAGFVRDYRGLSAAL